MFLDICCGFSKHYIIQVVINRISYDYTVCNKYSYSVLSCLTDIQQRFYQKGGQYQVGRYTVQVMPHPAVSPCAIEPEFEEVANSHFCNRRELNDMVSL